MPCFDGYAMQETKSSKMHNTSNHGGLQYLWVSCTRRKAYFDESKGDGVGKSTWEKFEGCYPLSLHQAIPWFESKSQGNGSAIVEVQQ
ncbi:hypothetical protein V6N13_103612 [Hibiscus sabdariffa]|uniref:Uncharacterized protein n=1 Tax=Hibiscus sabdariffa TaxID=183260 RepID=A0ABR2B5U4_9ROSI